MPRKARVVIPGIAHHVVQRGNYKQIVFDCDQDFRKYAYWTQEYAQDYGVNIHAYCLMHNHVHFIVTPTDLHGMANMFKSVHMLYSQYKNMKNQRTGHLWQGRFYSCVLSDQHLMQAIRYVEMNPVRAKMVRLPWEYRWSSTRQHMQMEKRPIIKTLTIHREQVGKIKQWDEYLLKKDDRMLGEIRSKTKKGLVIGSSTFIRSLERKTGRVLRELKVGRPVKGGQTPIKK